MTVQRTYTEQGLLRVIQSYRAQGKTLRTIADMYPGITYGDIHRALQSRFPKSPHKRHMMGLPALIPAPACNKCGQVHVSKRCPNGKKQPTNWREGEAWWERLMKWLR